MKECDNRKTTYKQQLHIVYMSCSNDAHLITKTSNILQHFATLHHTSSNYTYYTYGHFDFFIYALLTFYFAKHKCISYHSIAINITKLDTLQFPALNIFPK